MVGALSPGRASGDGRVRVDAGKGPASYSIAGWMGRTLRSPGTAALHSLVKDGVRNKYIKGQERRIYCLLKVWSI